MNLIFIGNPQAGKSKAIGIWVDLEKALKKINCICSMTWASSKDELEDLVKRSLSLKPDIIISLGGDGSAHHIMQYFYKYRKLSPDTLFTLFPIGTGNDWARYWKIPHKVEPWLHMINAFKSYSHDLGQVEYTGEDGLQKTAYFNNVAGMAYDAYIADYIESKKKKMKVGGIQYLYFIFRCLFGYQLQASRLIWQGGDVKDKFYTINVGICPYSGGGIQIVPHAIPDDGLLAVTAIRPLNKIQVLLISRHFYSGKLDKHKKALAFQTSEILVEPQDEKEIIKLEAEGEYLGKLPARFTIIKHAFKICAP
ncbi:MAG: diacylglycerol kinase family protein [Saprospiraceae bacterium]